MKEAEKRKETVTMQSENNFNKEEELGASLEHTTSDADIELEQDSVIAQEVSFGEHFH